MHGAARFRPAPHIYRHSCVEPTFCDVKTLRVPRAGCWVLGAVLGAGCLALSAAPLTAQQPAQPSPQAVQPSQMPLLPLTQLDERGTAADLDSRAFTLTFAQPVPIKDLLLMLVRGTSLSV